MKVLKIVAEGLTTSFRYPHFMQQIHPSFSDAAACDNLRTYL